MSGFQKPPAALVPGSVSTTTILDGTIANADIDPAAAIAYSKLAALTVSKALVSDSSGIVTVAAVSATELGYVVGVTSALQTQMNLKAPLASPTFSGTITTPLTASRAMVTGASSELAVSSVTSTELGYVSGVTSAIQTQLNAKATDSLAAHLAGTETFTGAKAFTATSATALTVGSLFYADTTNSRVGIGIVPVAATLQVKVATDIDLLLNTVTSGMLTFNAINDSNGANVPMEFRASKFYVSAGNYGFGEPTPGRTVVIGSNSDTTNVNLRLNGLSLTGANVGTMTNCPHTGNPALYVEVDVKGSTYCIPCFALS